MPAGEEFPEGSRRLSDLIANKFFVKASATFMPDKNISQSHISQLFLEEEASPDSVSRRLGRKSALGEF